MWGAPALGSGELVLPRVETAALKCATEQGQHPACWNQLGRDCSGRSITAHPRGASLPGHPAQGMVLTAVTASMNDQETKPLLFPKKPISNRSTLLLVQSDDLDYPKLQSLCHEPNEILLVLRFIL